MRICRRGFTLIELLVVISIIALLLAILYPALSAAKRRAQTVVCGANLKNYGSALHMYTSDNRDYFPPAKYWLYSEETLSNTGRGGCPPGCRWHYDVDPPDGSLWPYLKSKDVHMCPTFKSYARNANCPNSAHSTSLPFNPTYSYSMNVSLGYDWNLNNPGTIKLTMVKRAMECFSFSEENLWSIAHRRSDGNKTYSTSVLNDNMLWLNPDQNKPDYAVDNIATYHNISTSKRNEGAANAVFVDGHVDNMRGLAGYDAYFEYGRPYPGHENVARW